MTIGEVKEGMEVVGADGVAIGTVDRVEGDRIKLAKSEGFGKQKKHHHYFDLSLVAHAEGSKVHLCVNADAAIAMAEDERSEGLG